MKKPFLLFVILMVGLIQNLNAQNMNPETIAQGQLDAYNNQDVEAFLSWYADDVEVYNFPKELVYKGIDKMRERYTNLFKNNPGQKAIVTERISVGNTVMDKEKVIGRASGVEVNVIAIYRIENSKIKQVYFVRE